MSEERFWRNVGRFVMIWSICAMITYGHIYKQFHAENAVKCADAKKINPQWYCVDVDRFEAVIASLFWPQHWSEYFWSRP